eukprot:gene16003-biopygen15785
MGFYFPHVLAVPAAPRPMFYDSPSGGAYGAALSFFFGGSAACVPQWTSPQPRLEALFSAGSTGPGSGTAQVLAGEKRRGEEARSGRNDAAHVRPASTFPGRGRGVDVVAGAARRALHGAAVQRDARGEPIWALHIAREGSAPAKGTARKSPRLLEMNGQHWSVPVLFCRRRPVPTAT